MSVGKSHRTPFKHFVLDKLLGSHVGRIATGRVKFIFGDTHIVDLCAGDGSPGDHGLSSPQIIHKHSKWAASEFLKRGCRSRVKVTMIEKAEASYLSLERNLNRPKPYDLNLIHGDARSFRLSVGGKNEAAFINADPNHVAHMPLARDLVESFPKLTTMTLTLGCNVGGIKRMKREDREQWFEYVDMCTGKMQSYHDAILCSVVRDASQWAYLSIIPKADTDQVGKLLTKAGAAEFDHGVSCVSFRDSAEKFSRGVDELFLQKKELQHA